MDSKSLALPLRLAAAVVITAVLVHYASPSKIILVLQAINTRLLLAIVPLIVLGMWLAALQLKIFTDCHGMRISLTGIVSINASTEFYNLFLPGVIAGGVIRWHRLSRNNRMRAQAFAVILMSRLLNVMLLLLLGILGWLIEGNYAEHRVVAVFLSVCLLSLAVPFLVLSSPRFVSVVRRRLTDNAVGRAFFREKLRKLLDAVSEYRQIPASGRMKLAVYATAWQLVMLAIIFLCCLALDITVPFGAVVWVRTIVGLASMLPLSVSGFGLREGGWIYFLGLYGVAPADAFVLSLLTFARNLFQAMIGFIIEMRMLFRKDKS